MSGLIIPLFEDAYPHIRFITLEDEDYRVYYATYMMMFVGDNDRLWDKCDERSLSLQESAVYLLGIEPGERRPKLHLPDVNRPITEPYVFIGSQASCQAKYWNNPEGWDKTVGFLKWLGYRVICLDQKPVVSVGLTPDSIPYGAKDHTGDRPLTDRARWLLHANFL